MKKSEIFNIYNESYLVLNLKEVENQRRLNAVFVTFHGEVNVLGKKRILEIIISDNFPLTPPSYYLISEIAFIPHIGRTRDVCYMQTEGVLWNINNPESILLESLKKAIKTIEDGLSGKNHADFSSEFEYYWTVNSQIFHKEFQSHIRLTNSVKMVSFFELKGTYYGADSVNEILEFHQIKENIFKKANFTKRKAIYIPLKESVNIIPPKYDTFWTREKISKIITENISTDNKEKLSQQLAKLKLENENLLIIMLPQSNGAKALFGIIYQNIRNKKHHPLLHPKNYATAKPFEIKRMDKEFILPRGGADNSLEDKKVAIIGCGSVGGYISTELTKAGILNLQLIDNDILAVENIFRHRLGKVYIGKLKVGGLKEEIERNIPYVKIEIFSKKIENLIKSKSIDFKKTDLIIVATGSPTINFYLNEYFIQKHKNKPVIYTWLDPYGIGGHALLTNNNNKTGCYKCIYTDDFHNKISFSQKKQKFTKSVSGCGSLYTPYGSIDALQTAILSVRLATDVLTGKEKDNPILSWKGNADKFKSEGFALSKRYEAQTTEDLFDKKYLYKNKDCPICTENN